MKTYKFYILFFLLLLLCNCRTMQLNQDGNVLGKGNNETTVGGGIALSGTFCGYIYGAPNLNLEVQQRFGLSNKVELQLKGHSDFSMFGLYVYTTNECNLGAKINLYNNNKCALSIIPFGGLTFGFCNDDTVEKGYFVPKKHDFFINPNTGFMLIGSRDCQKNTCYWGGSINFSPNLLTFVRCCTGEKEYPSFETDITLNLGWETKKEKVIYRHEISLFSMFNFNLSHYTYSLGEGDEKSIGISFEGSSISWGISYHFSAAFRQIK